MPKFCAACSMSRQMSCVTTPANHNPIGHHLNRSIKTQIKIRSCSSQKCPRFYAKNMIQNKRLERVSQKWQPVWPTLCKLVLDDFGIKTRANIRTKRVSQKWQPVWPTLRKLVLDDFGIKTRANIRTKRVSQKWQPVWPTLCKLVLDDFGIKTRQSKDLDQPAKSRHRL